MSFPSLNDVPPLHIYIFDFLLAAQGKVVLPLETHFQWLFQA